jgi:hypothetical protein
MPFSRLGVRARARHRPSWSSRLIRRGQSSSTTRLAPGGGGQPSIRAPGQPATPRALSTVGRKARPRRCHFSKTFFALTPWRRSSGLAHCFPFSTQGRKWCAQSTSPLLKVLRAERIRLVCAKQGHHWSAVIAGMGEGLDWGLPPKDDRVKPDRPVKWADLFARVGIADEQSG